MKFFLRNDGNTCRYYILLYHKLNVKRCHTKYLKHWSAIEQKNDLKLLTIFFKWKKRHHQLLKILIRSFTNILEVIKIYITCFIDVCITRNDVKSKFCIAMRFFIILTITTKTSLKILLGYHVMSFQVHFGWSCVHFCICFVTIVKSVSL